MDVETHEILFSFDQPANVLPALLKTVQQLLAQLKTRAGKSVPLFEEHCVLIIDGQQARASYLAQALSLAGYRVLAVPQALEAFTLFLQGAFIPLLIITGQDDPAKRFFQQRLVQQVAQRFDVELPLVRLTTQMPSFSGSLPHVDTEFLFQHPSALVLSGSSHPLLPDSMMNLSSFPKVPLREESSYSLNNKAPISVDPPLQSFSASLQANASYSVPVQQSGDSYSPGQDLSVESSSLSQLPFPIGSSPDWSVGSIPPISQRQVHQTSPLKQVVKKQVKISLEGQSLGRYQVDTLIGKGPLGDVYQVYDRLRETRVALKAIQTDTVSFAANLALEEEHIFQYESTMLNRLKHAHIAPVLNTGKSYISGSSFIYKTMPFYAEGTLAQWIYGQGGPKARSPREILPLMMQLADALQFIHDQQMVFSNFKPGNILLKEPVKTITQLELVLSDFSIAFDNSPLPIANDAWPYLAPERWEGKVWAASDQYALAVLAYELLTGRPLFLGTNEQIMKRLHLTRNPQSPSTLNPLVPTQVSSALLRALAKKPQERFASVGLFAQALQRFSA